MTPNDQRPQECEHFDGKKHCKAGWFHSKCCLCYKCIHCPKFTPKTNK